MVFIFGIVMLIVGVIIGMWVMKRCSKVPAGGTLKIVRDDDGETYMFIECDMSIGDLMSCENVIFDTKIIYPQK